MFESIYAEQLSQYYDLRSESLSDSAKKHELCYLRRFDAYVNKRLSIHGDITEDFISEWIGTLSGKGSSIENEVIVIRQFLSYLQLLGEHIYLPSVPKVHDDYIPYIFSDAELHSIFTSADNVVQKDCKADPYLVIEFPVIIRLLYSCGLRLGETVKIDMSDVDLVNGVLRMVNTKGDKHRLVPMPSSMTDILTSYCMAMGIYGINTGWLFPASRHKAIYPTKRYGAGLKRYSKIMVSALKTVKSSSVDHACTVCGMFLLLSPLHSLSVREGIWMVPYHSCLSIWDMMALMKHPST